jgi:hypothetical protein
MVLVIANIQALAADVPLAVQVVLVAPAFDDLIIFDANLQSAQIGSQHTGRFFPLGHIPLLTLNFRSFAATPFRLTILHAADGAGRKRTSSRPCQLFKKRPTPSFFPISPINSPKNVFIFEK